jgi:hypothetical protein
MVNGKYYGNFLYYELGSQYEQQRQILHTNRNKKFGVTIKISSESLLGSAGFSPLKQPCPIYARYMCFLIFSEKSKIICKVRHYDYEKALKETVFVVPIGGQFASATYRFIPHHASSSALVSSSILYTS